LKEMLAAAGSALPRHTSWLSPIAGVVLAGSVAGAHVPGALGLKATVTLTASFIPSTAGRALDVVCTVNGGVFPTALTVRQSLPTFLITNCLVSGVKGQPPVNLSANCWRAGVIWLRPVGFGHFLSVLPDAVV
jgi:hypothetical protein